MNLDQLTVDAKRAQLAAIAACNAATDSGTCNLDATFLPLEKGQRAAKVLEAIRRAGLSANATRWIGRGIMIQPPGIGQANKRYASNAALCTSLHVDGWPVIAYHQMD